LYATLSCANRRAIVGCANRGHVIAVVHVIKQIEHLDDAVEGSVVCEPEVAQDSHIHAMQRLTNEVVALFNLSCRPVEQVVS
jgi:hypothetical protein